MALDLCYRVQVAIGPALLCFSSGATRYLGIPSFNWLKHNYPDGHPGITV